jgi:hypothetical protein
MTCIDVKYLGSCENLQEALKKHCNNVNDPVFSYVNEALKGSYDLYVHLFPVKSRGGAEKIANKMLFSWVYEWNAKDQGTSIIFIIFTFLERCQNRIIRGKVYFPQKVEVDQDILEKLQSLKV